MANNHWHYQLMYHKVDMKSFVDSGYLMYHKADSRMKSFVDGGYYAIHEYYPMKDGDVWTETPVVVDGESVEEVKEMLQMMLADIEKHGVKDYE